MIGLTLLVIAISGLVTTILVNKRIDKLQNVVEYLENDNKQLRTQLGEDYKINDVKTYADKTFIKKADNNQVTYNG